VPKPAIATPSPLFFSAFKSKIDQFLDQVLTRHTDTKTKLSSAMRYSALAGGKRIRPILTLCTAECFGVQQETSILPACAVELIHAYSLVHDDLPAMDDDDLRRGKPTCHKAYDEATAILVGDALQTLAFELLTSNEIELPSERRLSMIKSLAVASGANGMVLGQSIDFDSVGKKLSLSSMESMHSRKTGALIEASVMLGALCCTNELDKKETTSIQQYARSIGLAFQVQDDILDVVSDTHTLGKTQGADAELNKPTYPSLLGLDGARSKLYQLHEEAIGSLSQLKGRDSAKLAEISHFIIKRSQ